METFYTKAILDVFPKMGAFCNSKHVNTINTSLGNMITFLTELHDDGLGYSATNTANTAKSVLSSVFEIIHKRDIGKEILIKRFMKGIFHLKPVLPKTLFTWDVQTVLKSCLLWIILN